MEQQIRIIAEQLITKGNLEVIESAYSKNYTAHAGSKTYKGLAFLKRYANEIRKAIPDLRVELIDILCKTDKRICWIRKMSGIHTLKFRNIPASNNKVVWYEMLVSRFDNNKIIEEWISTDLPFQLLLKNQFKK